MSRTFFVKKGSGGFRLVIDLKYLNTFFEFPKVKFESLPVLKFAPKNSHSAISVDISDAYHHLRVHESI